MPSAYWGKRAGGFFDTKSPKGHAQPWGFVIKLKRGGGSSSNNSAPQPKHYTKLLAENAARVGFRRGIKMGEGR